MTKLVKTLAFVSDPFHGDKYLIELVGDNSNKRLNYTINGNRVYTANIPYKTSTYLIDDFKNYINSGRNIDGCKFYRLGEDFEPKYTIEDILNILREEIRKWENN